MQKKEKQPQKLVCAPKMKVPNSFGYFLLLKLAGFWARTLHIKIDKNCRKELEKVEGPVLALGTHLSAVDFEYMAELLHKKKLAFVISANMYYDRRVAWFFKLLGNLIPKKQFTTDFECIKAIKKFVDLGVSVGLYPEGRVSMCGTQGDITPATVKLIKWLKIPVVFIHGDGSYLLRPRYSNLMREGGVNATGRVLFTKEETETLSNEEIAARLSETFVYNDMEYQERNHVAIRSKQGDITQGLNNLLYKCPACGCEFKMKTAGDTLFCAECGNSFKFDEYGVLTAVGNSIGYNRIDHWYEYQKAGLKAEIDATENYVLRADVDLDINNDTYAEFRFKEKGVLTLDSEGYHFRGTEYKLDFSISGAPGVAVNLSGCIDFFSDDTIYRFVFAEKGEPAKFSIATELLHNKYHKKQI